MRRIAKWVLAAALLVGATGCAVEEEPAAASVVGEAKEVPVVEATLGGSYDLHVEPQNGDHGADTQAVLRFPVTPGEPFAAVMRRQGDSDLDPWLGLYVEGERVAVSDFDQAILPMAAESDAVIVFTPTTEEDVILFAGDRDLAVRADFQIDLIPLDLPATDLALHHTSPGTRAITEALRELEPQTEAYLAAGMLGEGADGFAIGYPQNAPSLEDRATLNGFVARQNDLRSALFEHLVGTASDGEDPALAPVIGGICGALWSSLRSETHRLR